MTHPTQLNRVERAKRDALERDKFSKHPQWLVPAKPTTLPTGAVITHSLWGTKAEQEKEDEMEIPKL